MINPNSSWTTEKYGPQNETKNLNLYLGVYGGFGAAQATFTLIYR